MKFVQPEFQNGSYSKRCSEILPENLQMMPVGGAVDRISHFRSVVWYDNPYRVTLCQMAESTKPSLFAGKMIVHRLFRIGQMNLREVEDSYDPRKMWNIIVPNLGAPETVHYLERLRFQNEVEADTGNEELDFVVSNGFLAPNHEDLAYLDHLLSVAEHTPIRVI